MSYEEIEYDRITSAAEAFAQQEFDLINVEHTTTTVREIYVNIGGCYYLVEHHEYVGACLNEKSEN